jgi:hypothetical protein
MVFWFSRYFSSKYSNFARKVNSLFIIMIIPLMALMITFKSLILGQIGINR